MQLNLVPCYSAPTLNIASPHLSLAYAPVSLSNDQSTSLFAFTLCQLLIIQYPLPLLAPIELCSVPVKCYGCGNPPFAAAAAQSLVSRLSLVFLSRPTNIVLPSPAVC